MYMLHPLQKPDEVLEIVGLVSRPELNGRRCKIVQLVEESRRWLVEVEGVDELLKIKGDNLSIEDVSHLSEKKFTRIREKKRKQTGTPSVHTMNLRSSKR
ncbi:hypothetical protein CYMTET_20554 [Cymbomonas tetramitiformis]|uniref:Uncharacterized protein n=1 Tax=Cymbomonas tetramitiformis TaxID=36881 RepID=A0AAE0C348_9CHLO|nr:hypothetical protein CYMTET_44000 [Cymbomonas tetramitiformis]KAK3271075.1 hypothetical protein CYMTET_20554 [Cymbomonas tetramitiformis]